MPLVNIKMYEGRSKEQKKEIAKRITEVIHEVVDVSEEYIWIVFEDIPKRAMAIAGKFGDED